MNSNISMPSVQGAKKVELSNVTLNNFTPNLSNPNNELKNVTEVETINLNYLIENNSTNILNNEIEKAIQNNDNSRLQELAVELFLSNGIDISKNEIKTIYNYSNGYYVVLNSGDVVIFSKDNNNMIAIDLRAGGYYSFYSSLDKEFNNFYDKTCFNMFKDSIRISGVLAIDNDTGIYLNDAISLTTFLKDANGIIEGLNTYPENVKNYLLNNPSFKGFFPCKWNDLKSKKDYFAQAFAMGDLAIYYNSSINTNMSKNIVHEIGHILDRTLRATSPKFDSESFTLYYSDLTDEIKEYYENFSIILQIIANAGDGYKLTGYPNVNEFFASAIETYLNRPELLAAFIPGLYKFLDNLFKNIDENTVYFDINDYLSNSEN